VIIELSDRTARHFGDTPETIARALIEKAALEDYRSERISLAKLSEILGLDRWKTEDFLNQHNARQPYTAAMLEEDRQNLEKILGAA
jgi:predicted HTH domain antitoxin